MKSAGDIVPVAGGDDEMTVGAFDMVSEGTEVISGGFVEEMGVDFELLIGADELEVVRVDRFIVMSVVDPAADPDWKLADAAKLEGDEIPAVGGTTELVLLSVKNEKEAAVTLDKEETELLITGIGVWIGVEELVLD